MGKRKKNTTVRDTISEPIPQPMTSIPVPHDPAQRYIGNAVFTSVVYDTNGFYYTAIKDVPAGTPLSDRMYWRPISPLQEVGIHKAFIKMLFADHAFLGKLNAHLAHIDNSVLTNVRVDGYITNKWTVIHPFNPGDNTNGAYLSQNTMFEGVDSDFPYWIEFDTRRYNFDIGRAYEFRIFNNTSWTAMLSYYPFASVSQHVVRYLREVTGDMDAPGSAREIHLRGHTSLIFMFIPRGVEFFDEGGEERNLYVGDAFLLNYRDFKEASVNSGNVSTLESKALLD